MFLHIAELVFNVEEHLEDEKTTKIKRNYCEEPGCGSQVKSKKRCARHGGGKRCFCQF